MGMEGKKQWRREGREKKEGTRKGGREGKKKTIMEGAQAGRQAGGRSFWFCLSFSFLVLVLILILILRLLILAIVILEYWGVDLPYLSQEIPDDFTFGTRYMYKVHYDVLRHMNGDEFSELCACRATRRKKRGKEFTQISRKKIIHSTILDTIQTIGTTIWCSVL